MAKIAFDHEYGPEEDCDEDSGSKSGQEDSEEDSTCDPRDHDQEFEKGSDPHNQGSVPDFQSGELSYL